MSFALSLSVSRCFLSPHTSSPLAPAALGSTDPCRARVPGLHPGAPKVALSLCAASGRRRPSPSPVERRGAVIPHQKRLLTRNLKFGVCACGPNPRSFGGPSSWERASRVAFVRMDGRVVENIDQQWSFFLFVYLEEQLAGVCMYM